MNHSDQSINFKLVEKRIWCVQCFAFVNKRNGKLSILLFDILFFIIKNVIQQQKNFHIEFLK